MKYEIKILLN